MSTLTKSETDRLLSRVLERQAAASDQLTGIHHNQEVASGRLDRIASLQLEASKRLAHVEVKLADVQQEVAELRTELEDRIDGHERKIDSSHEQARADTSTLTELLQTIIDRLEAKP